MDLHGTVNIVQVVAFASGLGTVAFATQLSPEECRQRLGDPAEPTRASSPGQARQGVLHVVQGNRLWLVREPRGYTSFWREFRGEFVPQAGGGTRIEGET
jgi:hypothetical protein